MELSKTEKEKQLIDMIDSCFTYGGAEKDSSNFKRYILPYMRDIKEKRFYEIYEQRMEFLNKHAKIRSNVYTDCEGMTYNSLEIIEDVGDGVNEAESRHFFEGE